MDYRTGLFYLANQTQGGHPVEAVLYHPQPEKDPPVWGWICIMGLIAANWKRIGGNLADLSGNIRIISPKSKTNDGDY